MIALTSGDGKITEAIGISWRIANLSRNQLSIEELHRFLRRTALGHVFKCGIELDEKGNIPYTFTMPCGNSITYPDIDEIPMENIPCSCGNLNHWFVKYEVEE